jgi:hypothetical protein
LTIDGSLFDQCESDNNGGGFYTSTTNHYFERNLYASCKAEYGFAYLQQTQIYGNGEIFTITKA